MVDLKKLITGFLLLAVLMSSVIYIFSSFRSEKTEVSDLAISSGALKNEIGSTEPLFENLPDPIGAVADSNPELPPIEDPSNLTDNLARKLTAEMATLDPSQGISISDKAEELSKNSPLFIGDITEESLDKDLQNFQREINEITEDFRLKKTNAGAEIFAYGSKMNSLLEDNFSRLIGMDFTGKTLTSSEINSLELAVNISLVKARGMEVPEIAGEFHRSFLSFLAYQKKALDLARDDKDPLRSSLIFQLKLQDYNLAGTSLGDEYQKLHEKTQALAWQNEEDYGFLASLFLPKKAHALFGIPIPQLVHDIPGFLQRAGKWVLDAIGEGLRKRLVNQMVQQTINWIQGGGKPRFIQDFKGFVAGEADKAVGGEIYKHFPQLCSPIAPWVRSAFSVPSTGGGGARGSFPIERTRCTLTMAIENVRAFNENFGAGGWDNFLEIIKPQNNVFGSIMVLSDVALITASQESAAATTKAQASGGILATRKCTRPVSYDIDEESQRDQKLALAIDNATERGENPIPVAVDYILDTRGGTPVDSSGGEIFRSRVTTRVFESCPQNGWDITTPGSTVGGLLGKATGAHLDFIINADDMKALAAAFVDSMVNKIISAGVNGLLSSTVLHRSPRQQSEELLRSCESMTVGSTEHQECVSNANEIAAIYESIRIPTSTLISTAGNYMGMFNQIKAVDANFLNSVPRFLEVLNFALDNCTSTAADFVDKRTDYMRYRAEAQGSVILVAREMQEASSSIKWLIEYIARVDKAVTTEDVDNLSLELEGKFDSQQMIFLYQQALDRWANLENIYVGIYRQLDKGLCPFPPPGDWPGTGPF